jgi:hypothetical protein
MGIFDYSTVTLSSNPVIGVPPTKPGFGQCPSKTDALPADGAYGIFIQGPSSFSMSNGAIQCMGGPGLVVQFDEDVIPAVGPTVTIDSSTIQNTELGVVVSGGSVAITKSKIQYNYNGVEQADDPEGNGSGTLDLSGGGNTVACSSNVESSQGGTLPGIDVYNVGTVALAADSVAWDTASPDYFSCDDKLSVCTCNLKSCSTKAGADDMDAVEDSTNLGGITTTKNTVSPIACQ